MHILQLINYLHIPIIQSMENAINISGKAFIIGKLSSQLNNNISSVNRKIAADSNRIINL